MRRDEPIRRAVSLVGGVVILLSMSVGDAFAAAEVRLLHAVSGRPPAELRVSGARQVQLEAVGFGKANGYTPIPAGPARLALLAGGRSLARGGSTFEDGGKYTVVAATGRAGETPELRVLRDGGAAPGTARLRAVSAAPEITRAQLTLDGQPLGDLRAGEIVDYSTRDPGHYRLAAVKPGAGDELAAMPRLNLVAGTAASAYLVGSSGERTRFVVLEDAAKAPRAGPATGLGGGAGDGSSWLAALLAAVLAGTLGAVLHARASAPGNRAGG